MIKAVIFDMYETLVTLNSDITYFGADISNDTNIPKEKFLDTWNSYEYDRTVGNITLKELLTIILKENNCYSDSLLNELVNKRYESRKLPFNNLHPEIIPMLDLLKEKNIKIGLISNSYNEERDTIKDSILFPYFNATCFSYEERIMKPNKDIFEKMVNKLNVSFSECIYVGDGGSSELEVATNLKMKALKANWYINRDLDFTNINSPMEVLNYVK